MTVTNLAGGPMPLQYMCHLNSACMAIKITIDRPNLSASPDEHDVFGAQQQSVLEALRVPVYAHHPADAVAQ